MSAETTKPEPELHAVWEGYLLSKEDESTWTVLKFKDDPENAGVPIVEAKHVVKHGKCDCKGFEHRLDCRHVKMVQHRHEAVDRKTARQAASRLVDRLEEWPEIDRMVLDGYETDGEDDTRVRRVLIRAWGRPVEVEGVQYRTMLGMMKPNVLIEVRIGER